MYDRADILVEQWQKEKPELQHLDIAAVIGRLALVTTYLDKEISAHHKMSGLEKGGFDVLASLRRSGAPYTLSPTSLYKAVMLTSGAMTSRLDRLEKKGLIERVRHDNDRRSNLVRLTDKGLHLIDNMIQPHLDLEKKLISVLNANEQNQLNDILKKWLSQIDF